MIYHHAVLAFSHISTKSWHGRYACYAVSWRLACTPDHSLNSHMTEKSHSEKFSIAKNKCNFGLWELVQMQLGILKTTYYWNNFFEFSRYSGFIFQVRWTKAKTITSDFSRISCTKNYLNRFIPDWVKQEMIGRRFFTLNWQFMCRF